MLDEGVARHRAGNLVEAAAAYRKILTRHPDHPDALNLLGLIHYQQGENQPALDLIARAIDIAPSNPSYQNNIGIVLCELGRNAEAIDHFRRAVALDGGYMDACINLGKSLRQTGQPDAAISVGNDMLQRAPNASEAHLLLALALTDKGNLVEAGAHYRRAVEFDPTSAVNRFNLGTYLLDVDDVSGAIEALRAAVTLDPKFADAQSQLGGALRRAGRPNDALAALTTALRLDPNHTASWLLLAAACKDLRRIEKAHDAVREAIRLDPASAEAHDQLGTILQCLGRYDEALAAFDRAHELNPDHPFAAANRAYVYLAEGQFAEGWRDYRGRTSVLRFRDRLFQDRLPDDLSGKRILLLRDQGLGDQIFFLRFVPGLKKRNAHIIYRGERKLSGIIGRIPSIDAIIDETMSDDLPDHDHCISVGDLPYVSGMMQISDIPAPLPLSVAAGFSAELRSRLAAFGPPPYIGATWRAGAEKFDRLSKVTPPEAMATALRDVAGSVVVLQRNPAPDEMSLFCDRLGRPACDMTALNEDLEAMLALLGELDDYVCVSNTNVHLRAGLDRASRVLVPFPAEYRWMNEGEESPWFPGCRIYRESYDDGWGPALAALAGDLATAFPG